MLFPSVYYAMVEPGDDLAYHLHTNLCTCSCRRHERQVHPAEASCFQLVYTAEVASAEPASLLVSCCMTCSNSSSLLTSFLRKAKEASFGALLAALAALSAPFISQSEKCSVSSVLTWLMQGKVIPCNVADTRRQSHYHSEGQHKVALHHGILHRHTSDMKMQCASWYAVPHR